MSIPVRELPAIKASFFTPVEQIVELVNRVPHARGGLVRVDARTPFHIVVARDPAVIEAIYAHKELGVQKSPFVLGRVRRLMRTGTFIQGGFSRAWIDRRGAVGPNLMRGDAIARLLTRLDPILEEALDRIDADADVPVDLRLVVRKVVVELTFRLFFSHALAEEEMEQVVHWTELLEGEFQKTAPWWIPTPANAAYLQASQGFARLAERVIAHRRRTPPDGPDALTNLFEGTDRTTGQPWTDDQIRDELFSVYFGASAMATPIIWTLLTLSRDASAREAVLAEVDAFAPAGAPTTADLEGLATLSMTLEEVSRLYPTFWCSQRYVDAAAEVGGYALPPKTMVVIMRYLAHRHPGYWDDPEAFDICRFAPERRADLHPFAKFEYGGGKRICVGYQIAPRIIKVALLRLLREFDFAFAPLGVNDPGVAFGFGTYPARAVRMRMTRRRADRPAAGANPGTLVEEESPVCPYHTPAT